jgi:hypothetical protein
MSASFQQLITNTYMAARVCTSLYACSWFVGLHAALLSSPDSYINDTDAMLRPCVSNTSMWCPSALPDASYDESTAIVRCVLPWGQVEQTRPLADAWVDIIGNETFNGSLIDITWQHTPRASKTTSVAIATKTASYQGIFVWGSIGGIATVLICGAIYTRVRRHSNKGRLDKQRPRSIIDAIQWGNPHDDGFINKTPYFPTNTKRASSATPRTSMAGITTSPLFAHGAQSSMRSIAKVPRSITPRSEFTAAYKSRNNRSSHIVASASHSPTSRRGSSSTGLATPRGSQMGRCSQTVNPLYTEEDVPVAKVVRPSVLSNAGMRPYASPRLSRVSMVPKRTLAQEHNNSDGKQAVPRLSSMIHRGSSFTAGNKNEAFPPSEVDGKHEPPFQSSVDGVPSNARSYVARAVSRQSVVRPRTSLSPLVPSSPLRPRIKLASRS